MAGIAVQDTFLPLSDAAVRLGVSRLKLREAIAKGVIPARRDNQGRWRVDLASLPADITATTAATPADPAALMEALFDEVEDLTADLTDAQGATAALANLAGRQGDALERLTMVLEMTVSERDRLADLTGRALSAADESDARAVAMQATADRAIGLLDRATTALAAVQGRVDHLQTDAGAKEAAIAAHAAQLDRLFALSEQALDKAQVRARREPGLLARMLGVGAPRRE